MSFTFCLVGCLTLIGAAAAQSGSAAICGVLLIVASNVVCLLEKILVQLRGGEAMPERPKGGELL